MEYTLQVHRTGAPVDRWDNVGKPCGDCGRLAERGRRLCILLQMRPIEGCDGVRVMHGKKQVTIFTIDMELLGRRRRKRDPNPATYKGLKSDDRQEYDDATILQLPGTT